MSVYQRTSRTGEITWSANFVGPDPEQPGKTRRYRVALGPEVKTKAEAERAEARLRVALEAPPSVLSASAPQLSGETVGQFATRWLAHVAIHAKPSTLRLYTMIVELWIRPALGPLPLLALDAAAIDAWKAWAKAKEPPRGAKFLNSTLGVLSSMCARAVKWRVLPANPCDQVERFPTTPPAFDFYTSGEAALWLATCAELAPRMHPFFLVGFRTGLRLGELVALRWGDVEFATARLHVQRSITRGTVGTTIVQAETVPKSGKSRRVDLPPDALAALVASRHPGERVFVNREGGTWTREAIRHPWERVTRASGLRDIGIHGMRHSYASQLVTAGAPLIYVQHQLGHSTIRMTERYAHLATTGRRWVELLAPSVTRKGARDA